jgi:HD-like signal output (HDOD) protein/DNA-binding NarL/FixJ family response regulator
MTFISSNPALILVVDDDRTFRHMVSEILRDRGYEVETAASATQALEIASRRKLAAALVDVYLPGVDGIQLLRYFRSRHVFRQIPVIMISAGVQKREIVQLLQLGVRDVILKDQFSPQDLVTRLEHRIAQPQEVVRNPQMGPPSRSERDSQMVPASVVAAKAAPPQADAPSRTRTPPTSAMIQALGNLRALPQVVGELLRIAASPDSSATSLEAVVRADPVIATRVLQTANSAAYHRGSPVTQLDEAVRLLGFGNIARIATSSSVLRKEDLEGPVGEDLKAIWRHNLAAALFAERMAPPAEKAVSFLGGLLHDLPSLFALQYLGAEWSTGRERALEEGVPLHIAVSDALDSPLEEISGQILNAYRIPTDVGVAIQEYHEFFLAHRPKEPGHMARRLDLAHHFAVAAGRPGTRLAHARPIQTDEIKTVPAHDILRPSDLQTLSFHEIQAGLERIVPEIPRLDVPVCLWRDPRWSVPDPVESLLSANGDCLLVERIEQLGVPGRVRLALAEPGTAEWPHLPKLAPILVLHRGSPPEEAMAPGVRLHRTPLSIDALLRGLTALAME